MLLLINHSRDTGTQVGASSENLENSLENSTSSNTARATDCFRESGRSLHLVHFDLQELKDACCFPWQSEQTATVVRFPQSFGELPSIALIQ